MGICCALAKLPFALAAVRATETAIRALYCPGSCETCWTMETTITPPPQTQMSESETVKPNAWKPYFLASMIHRSSALPPAKEFKSVDVYKQDMRTHSRSPFCPEEKFESPVLSSQDIGWGANNPDALKNSVWSHGRKASYITKFQDNLLLGP